jgi:hypothetical protein
MSRPWKRKNEWPRVGRRGVKSYVLGFRDHEGAQRTRHFPSAKAARDWTDDFIAAERRGLDSLRRFLLDLDAHEANEAEGRPIGEIVQLYFAMDADPSLQAGLAPGTFARYRCTANCHILGEQIRNAKREPIGRAPYAVALACLPAASANDPQTPRTWRAAMIRAGVPAPTRSQAWRVLSAALSWAAGSDLVPEVSTNGCLLANERTVNRRRSARRGSTGRAASGRRRGSQIPGWALSPPAVEAIRDQMLLRVKQRDPILPHRDAMIVSLQYGLASRNQEMYGLRWMSMKEAFAEIVEVISEGELDEWGKTAHSTERRTAVPDLLAEDLEHWRFALRRWGHPARELDFIIPGDLGGKRWGVLDEATGAVHFSAGQAGKWGKKFFTPAVEKAALEPGLASIEGATPYALRRGAISVRLRAEDAQTVASECGTSLQMLDAHYAFAIDDLRRFGPRPVDTEWREARASRCGALDGPTLRLAA